MMSKKLLVPLVYRPYITFTIFALKNIPNKVSHIETLNKKHDLDKKKCYLQF